MPKIKYRVETLKNKLREYSLDALVIPSADPHQSEYLPDHWKVREWISGFTGSAGLVIVTRSEAGLWTDSRYFIQADQELEGTGIQLFRMGVSKVPGPITYLRDNLREGDTVALNPRMWSQKSIDNYTRQLKERKINVALSHTPAEEVWIDEGRVALPSESVFVHPFEFAGRTVSEKLELVRREMNELEVNEHLITTLDDIAWLFNLRGFDVAFNPVFLAYAVVRNEEALLFVDPSKITPEVQSQLSDASVSVVTYEDIDDYLSRIKDSILVNPEDCNAHLYDLIPDQSIMTGKTITRLLKACKSKVEIKHIDDVMIKDGIALTHAFCEMFDQVKNRSITEAQFADIIAKKRSEQPGYYGESFPAIVGYEANGAIVHYRPSYETSATIQLRGLLLCDSGGQYFNGTTDITRTVAMGPVNEEQRESYTRVLKGHIAIDRVVFPKGTTGGMLDILARQHLWANGQNFGHGTGHGVGFFLNVHEPPQGISPGTGSRSTTAFQPGMLTSNEPGYYEAGAYGIRIENLIITEEADHKGYLKHRHVTLFPIDTSLIVRNLMTRDEVRWINEYHALVAEKLLPHLDGREKEWVERACIVI